MLTVYRPMLQNEFTKLFSGETFVAFEFIRLTKRIETLPCKNAGERFGCKKFVVVLGHYFS
ncbi:MAG: hypothetical protein JNN25_04155 [Candidatus Kapabacteria bacterium]|nr:hypothetical protein [Candidatus Kapabacteria bacterium]